MYILRMCDFWIFHYKIFYSRYMIFLFFYFDFPWIIFHPIIFSLNLFSSIKDDTIFSSVFKISYRICAIKMLNVTWNLYENSNGCLTLSSKRKYNFISRAIKRNLIYYNMSVILIRIAHIFKVWNFTLLHYSG